MIIENYLQFLYEQEPSSLDANSQDREETKVALQKQKIKAKKQQCERMQEPAKGACLQQVAQMEKSIGSASAGGGIMGSVATASDVVSKFAKDNQTALTAIAGTTGVALGVLAAMKLYHKFAKNTASQCKNSPNKSICLRKGKLQGLQKAKGELTKSLSNCKSTNNPEGCQAQVQKQINKYNRRIEALSK